MRTALGTRSIPFTSGESNYSCIKIPVLLQTTNDSLLAVAEARRHSCSDFAWTDLVAKRSRNGGASWSPLSLIRSESGPGLPHTVIGNAAPVQLTSGRILLVHTRNNSDVWLTSSDDDGVTWAPAWRLANVTLPSWAWVGTGPPGSIQLRGSGRIVVPAYHSKFRGNVVNNLVHGHTMLSDDEGASWRLGSVGDTTKHVNENQLVELANGSVLLGARSLATLTPPHRIQARSDDGGETFGPTRFMGSLPQPLNGCEGSMVRLDNGTLFLTTPDSYLRRTHLTLYRSEDEGGSWQKARLIDSGASGYSSLQPCGEAGLCLLYEQSDAPQVVMTPDRFVFMRLS